MIFYQSNFCPECGNETGPRSWWRNRYFCEFCAARLRRKADYVALVVALSGMAIGVLFSLASSRRPVQVIQQAPPAPVVSAMDATARLKPAPSPSSAMLYFCGAITKKGTPCRRKVAAEGDRCFQHQGIPSPKKHKSK